MVLSLLKSGKLDGLRPTIDWKVATLISPEQCRAARGLLGWSQRQLSKASGVTMPTISTFESCKRAPYDKTIGDIQDALQAAGVVFISGDGKKQGVRFR